MKPTLKIILFLALGSSLASYANGVESPMAQPVPITAFIETPPTTISSFNRTVPGTLSFYFQDIDIRALLQIIAKNSGLNFVISDSVKGNITLNLKNVTWEKALYIVLKSNSLAARREGNVVMISTLEEMTANEAKQLQSEQELKNLAPLISTIIQLKYTNAADMATMLKGEQGTLLTPRGQIAVDSRTNSIIIRDTSLSLAEIRKAISQLDIPAKQVLIEARIVSIDKSFERQMGVKFGLTRPQHLSGTITGANQLAQETPAADVPVEDRLNFNLPAGNIFTTAKPGSIALALARIGSAYLDLELSALEGEGHVEIISSPHVVTSNQQKALIQTGEEIPYQEATSSGATAIEFKKAVLSLEITPQITPNNKIILKLKATQDKRGASIGAGLPPAIDTQEVQSNILLRDNETIVIGGVYKQKSDNIVERVPFLGTLPIVGALFRHSEEVNSKNELLIFITPKIIKTNGLALYKENGYDFKAVGTL